MTTSAFVLTPDYDDMIREGWDVPSGQPAELTPAAADVVTGEIVATPKPRAKRARVAVPPTHSDMVRPLPGGGVR